MKQSKTKRNLKQTQLMKHEHKHNDTYANKQIIRIRKKQKYIQQRKHNTQFKTNS